MLYRGKVARIINNTLIDVELILGFGVSIRRKIYLDSPPVIKDEQLQKKAIHCMVVLMGGKPVFVEIKDNETPGRCHGTFYRELDNDHLDCFSDFLVSATLFVPANVININKYLNWLATIDFDVNDVKERVIHGRSR